MTAIIATAAIIATSVVMSGAGSSGSNTTKDLIYIFGTTYALEVKK